MCFFLYYANVENHQLLKNQHFHYDREIHLPIQNETGSTSNKKRSFFQLHEKENKKKFTNLITISYDNIFKYAELSRDTFILSQISLLQPIILDKKHDCNMITSEDK